MSSDGPKKDPVWNYAHLANANDRNAVTCAFCGVVSKGGAFRAKQHIVGGYRNVKQCAKYPEHVREEIKEYMEKKHDKENVNFCDVDQADYGEDEDDDVVEVQRGGKKMSLSGSMSSVKSCLKRPSQKGPLDVYFTDTPETAVKKRREGKMKQTTINEKSKEILRERALSAFSRWMYDVGISFNAVKYHSFSAMVEGFGQFGPGMKPPTYHEVRVTQLKKEVISTEKLMKSHKEEWARYGCSVMADGWKDKRGRHLINFLVNCSKGSMFMESLDSSAYVNSGEKMFQLLDKFVEKIGATNVVQVVTDSASINVLAGKLLEAKYPHLFWSPCAAHCLDLMLEDIGKLSIPGLVNVPSTMQREIELHGYIYNKTRLLNLMREYTGKKELLKPAKTRFATCFLTLSSIHRQKAALRNLFVSEAWTSSQWAREAHGRKVAQTVLSPSFWNNIVYCLKVSGPLVKVLRLVDGEKKPPMGYIYEAMDRAKEAIANAFNGNESKYEDVWKIIDNRWNIQLHQKLHGAGYFLNPKFVYANPDVEQCAEVVEGFYDCITRLVPDITVQDKICVEVSKYKKAEGMFAKPMAIRHKTTKAPADWWSDYAGSTPNLQIFAIKILSLTCSASGCEQNWSTFEHALQFVKQLGQALHSVSSMEDATHRLELIYVIPAPRSQNLAEHDFGPQDLQQLCDFVDGFSLMTYDFSGPQSPGPNAPLSWIRSSLQLLLGDAQSCASKIFLGINFYGNDFILSKGLGGGAIIGRDYLSLLEKHRPVLQWEERSAEHFFIYSDNDARHAVFFPSLMSISTRMDEARGWGAGLSIWEIGQGLDYFFDLL